ncbi:MAG: hypothetical protein JST01_26145 [Cyanobacteria bacterium SZAS TMP-1]|nr:hypothetical protein [Cyanobacteria bacterium SZAS TMP-1]
MFRGFKRFLLEKAEIQLQRAKKRALAPKPGGANFSPFRRVTRRLCALVILKVRESNKSQQKQIDRKIAELREAFRR